MQVKQFIIYKLLICLITINLNASESDESDDFKVNYITRIDSSKVFSYKTFIIEKRKENSNKNKHSNNDDLRGLDDELENLFKVKKKGNRPNNQKTSKFLKKKNFCKISQKKEKLSLTDSTLNEAMCTIPFINPNWKVKEKDIKKISEYHRRFVDACLEKEFTLIRKHKSNYAKDGRWACRVLESLGEAIDPNNKNMTLEKWLTLYGNKKDPLADEISLRLRLLNFPLLWQRLSLPLFDLAEKFYVTYQSDDKGLKDNIYYVSQMYKRHLIHFSGKFARNEILSYIKDSKKISYSIFALAHAFFQNKTHHKYFSPHYLKFANIYKELDDFESAKSIYTEMCDYPTEQSSYHWPVKEVHDAKWSLAEVYAVEGNYMRTCGLYMELLDHYPNNGILLENIGTLYNKFNDLEKAINFYKQSIEVGNDHAYYSLAAAYANAERYEALLKTFNNQNFPERLKKALYGKIGYAYYLLDNYSKAIEYFKKDYDLNKVPLFLEELSYCYLIEGNIKQARKTVNNALATCGQKSMSCGLVTLGCLASQDKEYDKAKRYFEVYYQRIPPYFKVNLALLYFARGEYAKVTNLFTEKFESPLNDTDLFVLAEAYNNLKKTDCANHFYQKVTDKVIVLEKFSSYFKRLGFGELSRLYEKRFRESKKKK